MYSKVIFVAALCGLCVQAAWARNPNRTNQPINNQTYLMSDEDWKEAPYTLPDYPTAPDWVGFFVPNKPDFKYFIDSKSLSVGQDGVVRLVLRGVSASGAENVSIEGIHCLTKTARSYAFGDPAARHWYTSTRAVWKRLSEDDKPRLRLAEDICTGDWVAPADAGQALTLLKKSPWY